MRYVPELPPTDIERLTEWTYRELLRLSGEIQRDADEVNTDFYLDVARGDINGFSSVNKFGRSTNVDSGVDTDIHDGANATDDVAIWVAPTQARVHAIVSTSADDDSAGAGAKTIQVYGLVDWDTKESSETITMDGTTLVNTSSSYVLIHRMKVLTKGASNVNVGVITATAATDGTVTAQINVGEGQTQMAIYGVPSVQKAYMMSYYCSAVKRTTAALEVSLLLNSTPDTELLNFQVKHTQGLVTDGSNHIHHSFNPPFGITGPAIIKMQANSNANDTDVSAGFDLVLEDIA